VYVVNFDCPKCPANGNVPVITTTTNKVISSIPVGLGPIAFGEFIIRPIFAGTQHFSNCFGVSTAALGNLNAAASRLGFYSVQGLQDAIWAFCG
jgi:hypothetical protein